MSVAAAAHHTIALVSEEDEKLDLVGLDSSPQTQISCKLTRPSSSHEPSPRVLNNDSEAVPPSLSASPVEGEQKFNTRSPNGTSWLGPTASATGSPLLRASVSSLPMGKIRFHSVHKTAGIGKHMNGRGVGRASKLAQLEVAAEHIGVSPHHVSLTSPRLLRSPGRKKSPIRWFPRKKTESYLERKIRMLQEKEGKVVSLDETLGAANLHLSRIEREKLATQAAAAEAMNSKKGALVEASWCRILKLAGIPCKAAVLELQRAEKQAAAALAEAENHGVILHHGPAERESTSEAVTASLDTAFDVDKEVTAAIKVALKHISSSDAREYDAALNRSGDMKTEGFLEADSQSNSETREECLLEEQILQDELEFDPLASVMVSRIRELTLEHQTALAGIVATSGLGALLKNQSLEQELNEKPADSLDCKHPHNEASDLGSILVKHVSRLQREVQAAKDSSKHSQAEGDKRSSGRVQSVAHVESLDQILVKHVSKLEKEKLAAQTRRKMSSETHLPLGSCKQSESCKDVKERSENGLGKDRKTLLEVTNAPFSSTTLSSTLDKHVSGLEKEKQTAVKLPESTMSADTKAANVNSECSQTLDVPGDIKPDPGTTISSDIDANEPIWSVSQSETNQRSDSSDIPGLGSILVKHVSRLEKEKQMALAVQDKGRQAEKLKKSCEVGLGDILVKRLSRLEIEKAKTLESREKNNETAETGGRAASSTDATWRTTKAQKSRQLEGTWGGPSMLHDPASIGSTTTRRKSVREKQLEDAWGGLSLGNTLKRHVSKLEKEQAAWRRAEEEARQRPALQR